MRSNPAKTFDQSVPLHHQIMRLLRLRIESGDWEPGEQIPTEEALVRRFGVSRTTVRTALRSIERDGLITRYRSRGTFVCHWRATPPHQAMITSLLLGYKAAVRVISIQTVAAPSSVAAHLGVQRGQSVRLFKRIEMVDGIALAVVMNYMRVELARRIRAKDLKRYSMLQFLRDKLKISFGTLKQSIEARMPDDEVASLLSIDLTRPVLFLRLLVLDKKGAPVQLCDTFYRADRYRYELEAPLPGRRGIRSGRLRMLGRLL